MASIEKRGAKWRAKIRIRRKGKIIHQESRTFDRKRLAESWAARRETELQDPRELERVQHRGVTVGSVLRWYIDEMSHIRTTGRTKSADFKKLLDTDLADRDAIELTSGQIVDHLMGRLKTVKPQTANNDLIWLRVAFKAIRVARGIPVALDAVEDASLIATSERLVARSAVRQRRPTADELDRLDQHFERRDRRSALPMRDIMWFAIHSTRRQAEITRLEWADNIESDMTGMVRDLKHPREKWGNHHRFAYTREAWEIAQRQPREGLFIFPYNARSVGAAFTRACRLLEIKDLRFHDLRHEGTSRLFESGYSIQEVQLVTLHESWQVLKRYTHMRPGDLKRR